ncbi:MAG: ATP-grasp domain-containing protein [Endomicrobiales bacterium]|nr:ATP-grasp domain-containing protein [Endomicrobiales bacterium]
MSKLKVLLLYDGADEFPKEKDFAEALKDPDWNSEVSIMQALHKLRYYTKALGFANDLTYVINEIEVFKPDVVVNVCETYLGEYYYDRNVPALLELLQIPYTGCSPAELVICNNKALCKKVLSFHKIKVPGFVVSRLKHSIKIPGKIKAPFFIKPLREEASTGITQASFAENENECAERIKFIHERFQKHAIVEEYINGRELYVGVLGGYRRPQVLPIWEMKFTQVPDDEPKIATYKAKWDDNYRKRWGIKNGPADHFPNGVAAKIQNICKKAYKVMGIEGHVRFDLRLTPENEVYIIEANANPEIAKGEDFAASAEKIGISYERLIEKLIKLALKNNYH